MCTINFFYGTFNIIKNYFKNNLKNSFLQLRNHSRGFVPLFFEATMNLAPIGVLCIFGNQNNMGRFMVNSFFFLAQLF